MELCFLLVVAPFVIPALGGCYLLTRESGSLSRMAGLLAIKPVVTTPIWLAIIAAFHPSDSTPEPSHFLSILPGAGLTLIIAIAFRRLFSGPRADLAWLLLALDCTRWLNSLFLFWPHENNALGCLASLFGLSMPTVFTVIALRTALPSAEGKDTQMSLENEFRPRKEGKRAAERGTKHLVRKQKRVAERLTPMIRGLLHVVGRLGPTFLVGGRLCIWLVQRWRRGCF
jgi:hypothetical protein